MSWSDFESEASSGAWVKLNVGMSARLQFVDAPEFVTKTWDDGKTERMARFKVIDHSAGEPTEKELEVNPRRAMPLSELRESLRQRGIDLAARVVTVECYAEKHPTKSGRTIGRWRVSDQGPAPAHGDVDVPF